MTSDLRRIEELMIDELAGALSSAEQQELDALLAGRPDIDRQRFERIAAWVFLAAADPLTALPDELAKRLLATAPST